MKEDKYSEFYLEICEYYGYEIKDGNFTKSKKPTENSYFEKLRKVDLS